MDIKYYFYNYYSYISQCSLKQLVHFSEKEVLMCIVPLSHKRQDLLPVYRKN